MSPYKTFYILSTHLSRLAKKTVFKTFGTKNYLKTLRFLFFVSFRTGLLKKSTTYQFHYLVKHLVEKEDTVIDIGANLGYFSSIFAKLTRKSGRLIAIEPIPIFFSILADSLKKYPHCKSFNCALGLENGEIRMFVPNEHGYLRTGLAYVSDNSDVLCASSYSFQSKMVIGSELLKDLDKIDYIKCDIEGYEEYVLPELKELLIRFKPSLQVETWGMHKEIVFALMEQLDYQRYNLVNKKIVKNIPVSKVQGDYLFIHKEKEAMLVLKLTNKGLA